MTSPINIEQFQEKIQNKQSLPEVKGAEILYEYIGRLSFGESGKPRLTKKKSATTYELC